ncbi:MAG: hypothetical protein V2A73_07705 [Pseudomonadota bacterium]
MSDRDFFLLAVDRYSCTNAKPATIADYGTAARELANGNEAQTLMPGT